MKYYKLIDTDKEQWPSFEIGRVYPETYEPEKSSEVSWHVRLSPDFWQEVPESEYLLQEAKERYPVGTRFDNSNVYNYATSKVECEVLSEDYNVNDIWIGRYLDVTASGDSGKRQTLYMNGKWAEIISKPKQENKEMEELKITKERVLSAAEKCSTAKATLKELFPEVFEENYIEKLGRINKNELIKALTEILDDGIPSRFVKMIPGKTALDKSESIAKLIYETWIKE